MTYPIALVLVAVILAIVWERNVRYVYRKPLEEMNARLDLQDKAIKNLADQAVKEVSSLKDKLGAMQLALGVKPKEHK